MRSNHLSTSCSCLSRPSTSFSRVFSKKDVDGRAKHGHDCREMVRHDRNAL